MPFFFLVRSSLADLDQAAGGKGRRGCRPSLARFRFLLAPTDGGSLRVG
jgi:hypothetical protein